MMAQALSVYIPIDRRHALAQGVTLPERTSGAALFADISGFTPLTEALARALGPRSAEELTRHLNQVYDALIAEVDHYRGSVIGFAGDAITCWFDEQGAGCKMQDGGESASCILPPASLRAVACALACQEAMQQFAATPIPNGETVALAMKAAVASGPARRFIVGDLGIQLIDALVGETLARMAAAEHLADKGEVIVDAPTIAALSAKAQIGEWRTAEGPGTRFAVVNGLTSPVEPSPWPPLAAEALPESQVRSWLLPPVYKRLCEGLGEFSTELRPAAVLFLCFEGIDYDGDAAAGVKLDAYVRWVQTIVTRHEGYLLQLTIGDKGSYLYAAFGAPIIHEDYIRRAVSAALELRSPPEALNFIRSVQIGISQGTTRAGGYGGTMRRTYGVLGDEVNLAARLMQHAGPGQVLVSGHVQKAVTAAFTWEILSPIQVKGKRELVSVARLVDKRHGASEAAFHVGARPAAFRLVGREAELSHLKAILEQALAGTGQIVRIEGGTGVGKSFLAAEFAAEAGCQGARVGIGMCQSTSQDIAYTPWRSVFRALLALPDDTIAGEETAARQIARVEATVERINPEWRIRLPLLGDLLDLPIPDNATTVAFDPRLRQEALFALAVDLVRACAHAQPVLLLIEDAHWMDEASLGLTLALGRVVAESPVLLVLVQRPPIQDDQLLLSELNRLPGYHQLVLSELAPEGIAMLVANRLDANRSPTTPAPEVSALAIGLIQARSQGNPFFAEELVDALRESGNLIGQENRWVLSETLVNALREADCLTRSVDVAGEEWALRPDAQLSALSLGIPDSVHGVVLARLDRLPELPKLTLKVASVVGRVFEQEVLAHAHPSRPGQATLQGQLDLFERRDFVRLETPPPHAVYMFKHNITQEVVYETLLGAQQRELHRAVGTVLEMFEPEGVEPLAHHFAHSAVRYKSLFYLDKAARKAQRSYANETALSYYNQALALDEFWGWRKGQVEILHILGRREEELAALCALEASPDAPAYEVAYLWGQYYEAVGDYAQAQVAVEHALTIGREQAHSLNEANCLAQLGLIARRQGDYERAKGWYQQALGLFHGDADYSSEEAIAFTQAFNGLGTVHRQQGNFGEAEACYGQALMLSRQSSNRRGEAETLNSLGVTAYYQRDFSKALTYHQQALAIRRAIGDRAGEGTSLFNLAVTIRDQGDYSQAEEYLLAALSIQQAVGNRWEEANIWNDLGVLYQELGGLAQAQQYLQNSLRLNEELGDESGRSYTLGNLGLVMRDLGDLETAEKLLSEGLAIAQKHADQYVASAMFSHLGIVSLLAGQYEPAIECANIALTMRRDLDLRVWTTADLATLALAHLSLNDTAAALDYAQQALEILDECQGEGPEFPHRDYFACYQLLSACGQTEAAYSALHSAYKRIMTRAENITDPALRQSFLENVPINWQIVQEARRVFRVSSSGPVADR
jgi:adenylate cyclase